MILASLLRVTDAQTARRVECTRCGQCCQRFFLPSLATLADYLCWAGHDCAARGCEPLDEVAHTTYRRVADWLLAIEPTEEDGLDTYRCGWYTEVDGLGTCTRYDERPYICANFPYLERFLEREPADAGAEVIRGFPGCAWHMRVFDFEPLMTARTLEAAEAMIMEHV